MRVYEQGKGHTALHLTAMNGHAGCAQMLLEAGADVNQVNDVGTGSECIPHVLLAVWPAQAWARWM